MHAACSSVSVLSIMTVHLATPVFPICPLMPDGIVNICIMCRGQRTEFTSVYHSYIVLFEVCVWEHKCMQYKTKNWGLLVISCFTIQDWKNDFRPFIITLQLPFLSFKLTTHHVFFFFFGKRILPLLFCPTVSFKHEQEAQVVTHPLVYSTEQQYKCRCYTGREMLWRCC